MRILIIENDTSTAKFISGHVEDVGYKKPEHIELLVDGIEYLSAGAEFDLVLVGLETKEQNYTPAISLIRKSTRADIFVLGAGFRNPVHRTRAYDSGASYVSEKPFHIDLLLAYIRWVIRRNSGMLTNNVAVAGIAVDLRAGNAYLDGTNAKFTRQEYRIFLYMIQNKGRMCSASEIAEHVSTSGICSNTIEVQLGRIRQKIYSATGKSPVVNVRGLGYRLCDVPTTQEAG